MKRIILDLDAGMDDAIALLVFLKAEKEGLVKVEALCCTHGNTLTENVCKNVVRMLELIGRTDCYTIKFSTVVPTNCKIVSLLEELRVMKRIILDLDVGTDDTVALLVLLKAENEGLVKIEAICCTKGNTSTENVCRNVVRILELIGRTNIPVYRGSEEQLICPLSESNVYHGNDGFGDIKHDKEPDLSIIKKEPSAIAMNEIASRYPGEIYLVCIGPLTNVALSMKLYKDFASKLKEIYIMGGNYKAIGNVTKTAEYNFHVDPESAHIVLNRAKVPISILTWETCMVPKITLEWRFKEFSSATDAMIQLLNRAEEKVYTGRESKYWIPCDAFLAIALAYPASIEKEASYHATVELHGHETRGQVVLDHLIEQKPNVRMIKRVNEEYAKSILLETSKCEFVKLK